MKGRRRCWVSVALVEMWLRDGCGAFEPAERVPKDIELVEVEFGGVERARGVVGLTFASSEWQEGRTEEWEPRFKRKGDDSAAHRQG